MLLGTRRDGRLFVCGGAEVMGLIEFVRTSLLAFAALCSFGILIQNRYFSFVLSLAAPFTAP